MRRTGYIHAILWGIIFVTPCLGDGQEPVTILNYEQILESTIDGLSIPGGGEYTFWVWSQDRSPLGIVVDSVSLVLSPHLKSSPNEYSWKQIGRLSIPEKKTASLQLFSVDRSQSIGDRAIGWLAFTRNPDWSPVEWFDLCRLYPKTVTVSDDKRLGIVRSKDHYYSFPQFANKREWQAHRQERIDHFLISMGCYPMPPKTPLNPQITGRNEYDDYLIENVYFESLPGFFATGNLYRPKGKKGPFPAVLCPHGHWEEGIRTNNEENSVPGRCINFAKQGYIVLAIDMVGYNDSRQLTHKFGGPAEWLWGLSLHGLQFWNSLRAIDYLVSLDEVDKNRIAVTGASGGGTQTYGIMAVDERVKVAAPVNMLSAHFQGGCLCENAANLRIGFSNLDFAALMAPRPLMMVSCTGDWTAETLRVEYPALRSIYELYNQPERLGVVQIDAGHNYNRQSREAVYAWFGRWMLGNKNADLLKEKPFVFEADKLRVFADRLPDNAIDEKTLIENWKDMSEDQLHTYFPSDKKTLNAFAQERTNALRHVLGVEKTDPSQLQIERVEAGKKGDLFVEKIILGRKGTGERIPAILYVPTHYTNQGTLLVHGEGKSAWMDTQTGKPGTLLQTLLDKGQIVLLADVFMTGEFHSPFKRTIRKMDVAHFLTYNHTETALRVQDIVTAMTYLQSRHEIAKTCLAGGGDAGLWVLLAAPLMGDLQGMIVDAAGFDDSSNEEFMQRLFVPGLRRVGDVRSSQALLAPIPLLVHNTGGKFDTIWAEAAYQASGAADRLRVLEGKATADIFAGWVQNLIP